MSVCRIENLFPQGVQAVYTTRQAGVSQVPYQSFNLGDHVGDRPSDVQQNRQNFKSHLPGEPCWLKQVHSTRVVEAGSPRAIEAEADASFTRRSHQPCVVMTADCLPVLLADRGATVVAAAHAGWRGLADGVLEQTVNQLACDPQALVAWLGPAIGPQHFQVGAEVREAFLASDLAAESAFRVDGQRYLADLKRLARQRLSRLGLKTIHHHPDCTFSNPDDYFSYRRDGVTGRMAAAIWLE